MAAIINGSYTYTSPFNGAVTSINQVILLEDGNQYVQVPNTAPEGHTSTSAVQINNQFGTEQGTIPDPAGTIWTAILALV